MTTLSRLTFDGGVIGQPVAEAGWDTPALPFYYTGVTYLGAAAAGADDGAYGSLGYNVTGLAEWRLRTYLLRGSEAQTGHVSTIYLTTGTYAGSSPADNTYGGDVQLRNVDGGKLACRWNYDSSSIAPTAYPVNTYGRVDVHWSSVAGLTCYVYKVDDDTTVDYTLADADAAGQPITGLWVAKETNTSMIVRHDEVELTDGTDPGPALPPEPPEAGNPSLLTLTAQGWG